MARDDFDPAKVAKAHSVFIRLVLPPYTIHFKSPTYMKEATLELLDKRVCKETLKSSAYSASVRRIIGTDSKFWSELVILFKAAVTSLERRSFSIWDPTSVDYESTSGALIASHYPGLWKDLERLNDLVSIGRNVLSAGEHVQDLAAEYAVEHEVFKLINCAVRVTARGYDGDAGTGEEEKWQWIVNGYKKLLITSLQFLNNLVAQNERRKLILWVNLFDSTSDSVLGPEQYSRAASTCLAGTSVISLKEPEPPLTKSDMLVAYGSFGEDSLDLEGAEAIRQEADWKPLPKEAEEGRLRLTPNRYAYFVKKTTPKCVRDYQSIYGRDPTPAEIHLDMPSRWLEMPSSEKEAWQRKWETAERKHQNELTLHETKVALIAGCNDDAREKQHDQTAEKRSARPGERPSERSQGDPQKLAPLEPPGYRRAGQVDWNNKSTEDPRAAIDQEDLKMLFTADAGTKILESGKAELMKRLEGYDKAQADESNHIATRAPDAVAAAQSKPEFADGNAEQPQVLLSQATPEPAPSPLPDDAALLGSDVWSADDDEEEPGGEEEPEEEEEEYPGSTEDGKGLLTDVPLILGPGEIEVLPMLIMGGAVPAAKQLAQCTTQAERNALNNMHTVRCHLLFAQDNGRNLLRELLIFVAAWDLREEELYFKFMVKIMESILSNGLMPYAYHAFRDRSRSKDIISPAQAVIMKLLTNIFRARSEANKTAASVVALASDPSASPQSKTRSLASAQPVPPHAPQRVDVHILNFIFTEFRQHIIPQTCALIFLQGQIHAGRASPDDFPLNLWDMERMYEGVYQYLEFFAVLTEEGFWKHVLGGWEIASELVTLLRELEGGIPKMQVQHGPGPMRSVSVPTVTPYSNPNAGIQGQMPTAQPTGAVAVERPFDVASSVPAVPPLPSNAATPAACAPPPPPPPPQQHQVPQQGAIFEPETPLAYPEDAQDEPSDFEWRNLKKLTVLVLSSLIWKNRLVQDQVRRYGGLEALVSCCRQDEHNPYIREHAIMCLRFAVEDNEDNAAVIRVMAGLKGEQQRDRPQARLEGGSVATAGPGPNAESMAEDVPREVLDANG